VSSQVRDRRCFIYRAPQPKAQGRMRIGDGAPVSAIRGHGGELPPLGRASEQAIPYVRLCFAAGGEIRPGGDVRQHVVRAGEPCLNDAGRPDSLAARRRLTDTELA
jgi:hypothetical protein